MIIIDLSYLCWRAHFTTGFLDNGVIFGVLKQLPKLSGQFSSPFIWFAADSRRSLRRELCPTYKIRDRNDEDMEDTFRQIDLLKNQILPRLGFPVIELNGYEADDIIAVLSEKYKRTSNKPVIVSGDEDLYQLLNFANQYLPAKDEILTRSRFEKKYGINPQRWALVKQIAGCSSDTVKGVHGVGESFALKYIKGELNPESKKYQAIKEAYKNGVIALNRKLVKLPFKGTEDLVYNKINEMGEPEFHFDELLKICNEYNFTKIYPDQWLKRFGSWGGSGNVPF